MKSSKILSMGLSLALASMMFTGCSDDDDATLDPAPVALVGTWTSGCIDLLNNESVKYTAVISDGSTVLTENNYWSDATCATLEQTKVTTHSATYGDARTLAGTSDTVYNVDGTNGTFSITPVTAAQVLDFNTAEGTGLCGFTDWAAGVAKTLTVANCTNDLHKTYVAEETADFYDIMAVLPSDSKLYIGDTDGIYDGTTATLRPIALEAEGLTKE